MIGYYVHHHGTGHLHRAMTLAPHLPDEVTGVSSLPRPTGWTGPWVQLPRDDSADDYDRADVSADGLLHWAPLGDAGLRARMSEISAWIERTAPATLVVDQSVEVCLLARLHGTPVVALTAPGRRTDPPHQLGFRAATALVGPWPQGWTHRLLPGLDPVHADRFHAVGAVSRFPVRPQAAHVRGHRTRPHALLLAGTGGDGLTAEAIARAQDQTPDWDWSVLSRTLGTWHADPAAVLAEADVVVLHPGQNALAEVAAMRVPAVVLPAPRPFEEQHVTAAALADGWPAVVVDPASTRGWRELLHEALTLDGERWADWCDGDAPRRIATVVARAAARQPAA